MYRVLISVNFHKTRHYDDKQDKEQKKYGRIKKKENT